MDLVGVLDEKNVVTVGVTTAYQVPSGKSAKIRLQFHGIAGVSSTLKVEINGQLIFQTGALTTTQACHTTKLLMVNNQAASAVDGSADSKTVAPAPYDYYLSEGDTVVYTIGTAAFASLLFQVVGVELDAE